MIQIALAQAAVNFFLGKTIDGALSAIGQDAYKSALKKLQGLISWKFGDRQELEQASENPEPLIKVINQAISEHPDFKAELDKLVSQIQEGLINSPKAEIVYSNVGSVASFDGATMNDSQVAGHDAIGGNQYINNFR